MLLICPACYLPHVDYGEWAERLHRTHKCEGCGHTWRPANVATVGVQELPKMYRLLLNEEELKRLFFAVQVAFHVDPLLERLVELNPDVDSFVGSGPSFEEAVRKNREVKQ
jgi:hypothetical protein